MTEYLSGENMKKVIMRARIFILREYRIRFSLYSVLKFIFLAESFFERERECKFFCKYLLLVKNIKKFSKFLFLGKFKKKIIFFIKCVRNIKSFRVCQMNPFPTIIAFLIADLS